MPSLQILHSGVYVSLCAVPLCTMASRGHQVSGSILIVLFAWDRISHWALNYTFQAGLACKWTTPPIPPGIWLSLSLIAGVTGTSSYSHLQRGYREFRGSRVCAARVLTYWVISLGPNFAGFFFSPAFWVLNVHSSVYRASTLPTEWSPQHPQIFLQEMLRSEWLESIVSEEMRSLLSLCLWKK